MSRLTSAGNDKDDEGSGSLYLYDLRELKEIVVTEGVQVRKKSIAMQSTATVTLLLPQCFSD